VTLTKRKRGLKRKRRKAYDPILVYYEREGGEPTGNCERVAASEEERKERLGGSTKGKLAL